MIPTVKTVGCGVWVYAQPLVVYLLTDFVNVFKLSVYRKQLHHHVSFLTNCPMSHTFTRIWIHLVFGTKHRAPLIVPALRNIIYPQIVKELQQLECMLLACGGMPDHVHVLYRHHPKHSVSEVAKQLKGGSAYLVNHLALGGQPFSWQTGFGAFSVSESQVVKVKAYINNQEAHHCRKNFEQEWEQ